MAEIVFRAATLDDAALASDLMTAAHPQAPVDPVMNRYRWDSPRRGYSYGRFILEEGGRPIAYSSWTHGPWERLPDRHCEVGVFLDRAFVRRGLLKSLWQWICARATDDGAGMLLAYAYEDDADALEVLAELGFIRDRVERTSELDLRLHGERIVREAAKAKADAAAAGIELLTLADWRDADKLEKLHEMDARTRQDIPHSLPILVEPFAEFERRNQAPDRPPERSWVALERGAPVALSYLKFPPVRGQVWTGYTATHPDYRGRGLARAVKLQSLAQAVEMGVTTVGTDNDEENSPMLRINRDLGYERGAGLVGHLMRVRRRDDG